VHGFSMCFSFPKLFTEFRWMYPYVTYWYNWADDNGVTHFTLCNFTTNWIPLAFGPGQVWERRRVERKRGWDRVDMGCIEKSENKESPGRI